ncbi:flavin reductase family protein [Leucobacter sp. USHLN153]|uniref:flavin reductase family protein n=1 Tax=Leucobacter sp. USHLN153 TaxID=3081268 RepID=UPI00301A3F33
MSLATEKTTALPSAVSAEEAADRAEKLVLSGAEALKAAFREHPSGVSLITAMTPEGPVGLTASSVASVGIDPPAIAFSVTRATGSAGGVLGAETHLVHLLDSRHAAVAQAFAVSGAERFTPEQGWSFLETGEPHLEATRVALRCRPIQTTPVGPSVVVIAEVIEAVFGESADPMVYVNREFHTLPSADRP